MSRLKTSSKPSAADRTVDMFTGSTNVEARTEEDIQEEPAQKASETLEDAADRRRESAFAIPEWWASSEWGKPTGKDAFRLTERDGWLFLEQTRSNSGGAYHWSGVMIRSDALYDIATVFALAAKARRAKEKANGAG